MTDKATQRHEIKEEILKVLERLGADGELLTIIRSWGDTFPDDEILEMLREWSTKHDSKAGNRPHGL
ncbi:MAG TPA: hypothetical protein VLK33_15665 [Terriglobales bacterium]|nr:hypothetical protein [Terriglobales bacterium]